MAYRNKTYVCFDGDSDIHYYRLMKAWRQKDKSLFNFHDAHGINDIWKYSSEETIKRRLKERMCNTSVFVVLVGKKTKYLYKYVRWEIELAIKKEIPIIVVNLNKETLKDDELCPAILRNELALHISYGPKIMQFALENWPKSFIKLKIEGESCAYYYNDQVYKNLQ